MSLHYQKKLEKKGYSFIAGVDEAGRGPLAGPLVCAAVIFKKGFSHPFINDSKQMTDQQRRELFPLIIKEALAYSIEMISPEIIDRDNIYRATQEGMMEAILSLSIQPDYVITDAMKLPLLTIPYEPLVKADTLVLSVAAASILAKVTRDDWMLKLHARYPQYQFHRHKGYPTPLHLNLLQQFGPIPGIYRYSYGPVQKSLIKKTPLF